MTKRSPEATIKAELKFFVEHDARLPRSEDVFVPARDLTIGFFIEGGIHIVGDRETLRVNLNSDDMLVLLLENKDGEHIYRFPWSRVVGFELVSEKSDPRIGQFFGVN